MHKATFARLALLCVLFTTAARLLAQNCGGATPEFDYQPQACPNGTAGAYARFGPPPNWRWDTYQWSVSAGTIVSGANSEQMQYIAPASGTVDITLTVTGGSGCGGTVTHTVAVTSEQNALIDTESSMCPNSLSGATAMYGYGVPGATYSWSITNGTFYGPTNGPSVQYIAGASGSMHLAVDITTPNSCNAHGAVDIPIQPPTVNIETWGVEAACPDRVNNVSLMGPYGSSVLWTATHARIIGSPMEPTVAFVPDGTGDVTLTALGTTTQACSFTATRMLPLQAAVTPQLVADSPTVCPNEEIAVNVANANEFSSFTWTISGGSVSPQWPQTSATVRAAPAGVVRVTVRGRLLSGCDTESVLELPIRTPDAAVRAPAAVSPNATYVVSVPDAGANASYVWDVTGGTLASTNANEATVVAGASGPVHASVRVTNGFCEATGSADTNVAANTLTPTIHTSGSTCVGPVTASVDNAANYATFAWQISGGFIDSAANGPSITYHALSSGDVTLSVHVTGGGNAGDATKTVSGVTTPVPMIGFSPASMCGTNGTTTATLMNSGSYVYAGWSVENAIIEQRAEYGDWITIRPTGPEAAAVTVHALAPSGCEVTGGATLPTTEPVTPVLQSSTAAHCGIGSQITVQVTNASVFDADAMRSYNWFVRNGIVQGSTYGSSITIMPTSLADVEVSVFVTYGGGLVCRSTGSLVVPGHTVTVPSITLSSPEVCPHGGGTASVPDTYGGYSWTIQNGTIQSDTWRNSINYYSDGTGPVKLSVQLWSPDGCQISTSTTVPLKSIAPPVITLAAPEICPYGGGMASVPDTYSGYSWTIEHGTLWSDSWRNSINFSSDGTAPVVLHVTVWSNDFCQSSASTTIPLKSIPPPVIAVSSPEICPYGNATASVPDTYSGYSWTIEHGTLWSDSWRNSVNFSSDGTAPVVLRVTVWSSDFCQASANTSVPLKSIPPPVITLDQTEVCPYGSGSASVPAIYSGHSWSIEHGTIIGPSWERTVQYQPDGTDAVVLHVMVWSNDMCQAQNSATVALKSIAPPVITLDQSEVCPYGGGSASVPAIYSGQSWSIEHGTIIGPSWEHSVQFQPDGTAPVVLHVMVWSNDFCQSSNSATVGLKSIAPPVITLGETQVCPDGEGSASVPAIYAGYSWSIEHGAITGPSWERSITYRPDGTGTVVLHAQVWSADYCQAANSAAVPLKSIAPPVITLDQTALCPLGEGSASVPATYASYSWSIEHGTITGPTWERNVQYRSDNTGPVVLHVMVWSSDACRASNDATVAIREVAPPTISAGGPTTFCEGGSVTLTASAGSTYLWSSGETTPSIVVSTSGSYSVTVTDANGCTAVSAPIDVVRETALVLSLSSPSAVCEGAAATATVSGAADATSIAWLATNATITGGQGTSAITFTANAAGTVELSVSVTRGACTVSSSRSIAVNALPQFGIDVRVANSYNFRSSGDGGLRVSAEAVHDFCGATSVSLTATTLDPSWTYVWSTGQTGPHIVVNSSGTYTLTATNAQGCSTSQSETVEIHPAPVAAISGATTICPGGATTLTASGGDSYLWSTGATTASINATQAGTYSVTVTTGSCSASTSVTVTEVAASIEASGSTSFCAGGSVTLTAAPAQSYLWTNGATTQSITVTASGTYGVAETFAAGCTLNATPVAVSVGPSAVTIAADDTSLCPNQPITLTSTITGGSNLTLQWLDGNGAPIAGANGPTYTFTPQQPGYGSVSLRATDANGCAVTSAPLTYYRYTVAKPVITPAGPLAFCEGSAVMLEASAASSYLWSTGATTRTITVSASGTYSVTTTDGGGCPSTSDPVAVTVLARPATPEITADGPLTFCEGASVTLSAPAGFTYLWSTGATTQSIVATTSGTYDVTVSNASGCSASNSAQVTVNALPATPTITGATSFCAGGSTTLTAPAGYTYLWSTGATTQSINVTTAGTYGVTITNANGCSASNSVQVTVNALPSTPTISGATSFCAGGSTTLTAPAGYAYLWSTGATTQSISVTTAGTYGVTITNASGCSATNSVQVTVNALPSTPSISGATSFCASGSTTLSAPAGFTYLWSTGATTQSINVTTAGTYGVTITNASGCSATNSVQVTVNALPSTPTITGATSFCAGGSTTLSAPAGYTYLWSTGATTQSINVTTAGTYGVTITNANGCSASNEVQVTVNALPVTPTITGTTSFCAGGSTTLSAPAGFTYLWSTGATTQSINVTTAGTYGVTITNASGCSASNNVQVTVNALPATPTISGATSFCAGGSTTLSAPAGYTYLWSTGATTQSINVTTAGTYGVTITNANGCSASNSVPVTVNAVPATPAITGATSFCAGGSTTLTAPAGVTYLWSTGATTQSINVTTAGTYGVTITNANGCSASNSVQVTVNALPATPAITGATSFCAGSSTTLSAPAGYTYLWSTGATTQSINVTTAGTYGVTITNASGCSASNNVQVTVNALPSTPTISGATSFCAGGSTTLTAPAGYTYLWSTGTTTQSINVTTAGTYGVTITNANGCSASNSVQVTVNALPSATITPSGPTTFCEGGSVTLSAPAGNTYLWSTGATTQSIVATASGTYSVTVTNANGCNASSNVQVTVNAKPAATITPNGPTTFCTGGSVTLTAPAGFTYLWSTGATTQSIVATTSGAYSVTVTNANGCSATSAATNVTVNAKPATPTITPSGPLTFCEGGSVTLTAPAGFTYLWSTGATTQSIVATTSGAYSVTVTNASGCSTTSAATNVTVNAAPAVPTITTSGSTALCPGASVTLTAPAGFTYLWSNGATTRAITVSTPAQYSVTVTNGSGCSRTSAPVAVTANAATVITAQPANATIARNATYRINMSATGTPTLTYQWYSGNSGDTSTPVAGGTNSYLDIGPFSKKGTNRYWVRVSSATCTASTVNSNTAVITVN